jgi:hypothetical protein
MSDNIDEELQLLRTHVQQIQDWIRFVWAEYLKWFAFICTLNVAAVGAVHFIGSSSRLYFSMVFALLDLGGCLSSIFVLFFTASSARGAKVYSEAMDNLISARISINARNLPATTPLVLGLWIGSSIIVALLFFLSLWIIIYRESGL